MIVKKIIFISFVLIVLSIVAVADNRDSVANEKSVERDWAEFQTLLNVEPPAPPEKTGQQSYLTWLDAAHRKATLAGLAFYERYPADPRHWNTVVHLLISKPLFVQGFNSDVEVRGRDAIIVDEAAQAQWEQEIRVLTEALLAAPDAPVGACEAVEFSRFAADSRAARAAIERGQSADWFGLLTRFDAHVNKYGELPVLASRADSFLSAWEKTIPGALQIGWRHLLMNAANRGLREKARIALHLPLEIAFIAADGREVDLVKLRGKVVLIDFWGTWCGSCIEELPNIKRVYEKYRERGFEVIGISFELDQNKARLMKFTRQWELPWPQYHDGKWWNNDYGRLYGVQNLPTGWLLDKEGRLVSTEAHGERLEQLVRRHLQLPPLEPIPQSTKPPSADVPGSMPGVNKPSVAG